MYVFWASPAVPAATFTDRDGLSRLGTGADRPGSAGMPVYTHDMVAVATKGGNEAELVPLVGGGACYLGPNVMISKACQSATNASSERTDS